LINHSSPPEAKMNDYEFWNELGNIFESVLAYQKKTIEFNKRFISPWVRLGNVFDREESSRDTLEAIQQATEIDPQNAQNWADLGDSLFKMDSYDEAINAYRNAVALEPMAGWPISNLALTLVTQGKILDAIPLYKNSIELFSDDKNKAVTWNRLGNAYRKLNDYENAVAAFLKADELDSENAGFEDQLDESDLELTLKESISEIALELQTGKKPSEDATDNTLTDELNTMPNAEATNQVSDVYTNNKILVEISEVAQPFVIVDSVQEGAPEIVVVESAQEPTNLVVQEQVQVSSIDKHSGLVPEPVAEAIFSQNEIPTSNDNDEIAPGGELTLTTSQVSLDVFENNSDFANAKTASENFITEDQPLAILIEKDGNEIEPSNEPEMAETILAQVVLPQTVDEIPVPEENIAIGTSQPVVQGKPLDMVEVEDADTNLVAPIADEPEMAETILAQVVLPQTADEIPVPEEMTAIGMSQPVFQGRSLDMVDALKVEGADTNLEVTIADELETAVVEQETSEVAYEEYLKDSMGPIGSLSNETKEKNSDPISVMQISKSGDVKIEFDTRNAHVWNELGNVYFNSNAYDDAIAAYGKAIELDRHFAWAYSNLALAYVQKERFAEAILLYQRGIELFTNDKDKAVAWNRLGNVYRRQNDYDNAIAAYQTADELDPENTSLSLRSRFSLLGNLTEQKPIYTV